LIRIGVLTGGSAGWRFRRGFGRQRLEISVFISFYSYSFTIIASISFSAGMDVGVVRSSVLGFGPFMRCDRGG